MYNVIGYICLYFLMYQKNIYIVVVIMFRIVLGIMGFKMYNKLFIFKEYLIQLEKDGIYE